MISRAEMPTFSPWANSSHEGMWSRMYWRTGSYLGSDMWGALSSRMDWASTLMGPTSSVNTAGWTGTAPALEARVNGVSGKGLSHSPRLFASRMLGPGGVEVDDVLRDRQRREPLGNAEVALGRMLGREDGAEQPAKDAVTYKADITDADGRAQCPWCRRSVIARWSTRCCCGGRRQCGAAHWNGRHGSVESENSFAMRLYSWLHAAQPCVTV
jgi:hypothetical protein